MWEKFKTEVAVASPHHLDRQSASSVISATINLLRGCSSLPTSFIPLPGVLSMCGPTKIAAALRAPAVSVPVSGCTNPDFNEVVNWQLTPLRVTHDYNMCCEFEGARADRPLTRVTPPNFCEETLTRPTGERERVRDARFVRLCVYELTQTLFMYVGSFIWHSDITVCSVPSLDDILRSTFHF